MTITSESIIHSIHTKLDALLVAAGGTAVEYGIGGIEKAKAKTSPRIVWIDHDRNGELAPLVKTGTDRREWALDIDRYTVTIWADKTEGDGLSARENCQVTAHNLLIATRKIVGTERGYGVETVRFGAYAKTRDGQAKRGIVMSLEAEIRLCVTDDIWATVSSPTWEDFGVILPSGETPMDELQEFTSEFSTEFTS